MIENIGINAGKVWTELDKEEKMNVTELKKVVKLTDKDLYAAFGWLAREEKLTFQKEGKEIFVSLSK